ncbi:hypothetical protein [Arthrobacter sp. TMS2-4]
MRIFKEPTSTEDRLGKGFIHAALVLGGVVLSWMTLGYTVESFGWLTGIVDPPAEVVIPARRNDHVVDYSVGVALSMFLISLVFGLLFAAGTLVSARETVAIFRRARRKARWERQWRQQAAWNSRTDGRPGMWPESRNDQGVPPGPGTRS